MTGAAAAPAPAGTVPCHLHVAGRGISEAEIAREMQHHRSASPEQSRADAARALTVRELLRCEIGRLGIAGRVQPIGQESAEEAQIRYLLEQEVEQRVPSEAECRRYFEQNRERFRTPVGIQVRHILITAPGDDADARAEALTRAERLLAQIKAAPQSFAHYAQRFSACPSKDLAGELGWLQRGSLTPELERQIFALPVGLVAMPVESRWGYHIVSIDARDAGRLLEFEVVRDSLATYLELRVQRLELQRYLSGLQERYGVQGLAEIEEQAACTGPAG